MYTVYNVYRTYHHTHIACSLILALLSLLTLAVVLSQSHQAMMWTEIWVNPSFGFDLGMWLKIRCCKHSDFLRSPINVWILCLVDYYCARSFDFELCAIWGFQMKTLLKRHNLGNYPIETLIEEEYFLLFILLICLISRFMSARDVSFFFIGATSFRGPAWESRLTKHQAGRKAPS